VSAPRRKDRLGSWIASQVPTREQLEQSRVLRPVAHRVLAPALWRFTRRSVPRGAALGLFVGILLMIPGLQIAGAALLALPFRANVPIAAAMTFLSMPATTPFILYASVYLGNLVLGRTADASGMMALINSSAGVSQWIAWLWSEAAPALLLGLLLIASIAAVLGYGIAAVIWRLRITRKWRNRHKISVSA
jgi:uncharacterized protein